MFPTVIDQSAAASQSCHVSDIILSHYIKRKKENKKDIISETIPTGREIRANTFCFRNRGEEIIEFTSWVVCLRFVCV